MERLWQRLVIRDIRGMDGECYERRTEELAETPLTVTSGCVRGPCGDRARDRAWDEVNCSRVKAFRAPGSVIWEAETRHGTRSKGDTSHTHTTQHETTSMVHVFRKTDRKGPSPTRKHYGEKTETHSKWSLSSVKQSEKEMVKRHEVLAAIEGEEEGRLDFDWRSREATPSEEPLVTAGGELQRGKSDVKCRIRQMLISGAGVEGQAIINDCLARFR